MEDKKTRNSSRIPMIHGNSNIIKVGIDRRCKKDELMDKKDICKDCMRKVENGQHGLKCDICVRWFHPKCEDITSEQYKIIESLGKCIQWQCLGCKIENENRNKLIDQIILDNTKMKEDNQRMREEIENNKKERLEKDFETKTLSENIKEYLGELGEVETRIEKCEEELKNNCSKTFNGQDLIEMKDKIKEEITRDINLKFRTYKEELNEMMHEIKAISKDTFIHQNQQLKEMLEENNKTIAIEINKLRTEVRQTNNLEVEENRIKSDIMTQVVSRVEEAKNEKKHEIEAINQRIKEGQDKSRREKNVIIFNVKENEVNDKEKIDKIIYDGLELIEANVEEIFRIGKRENTRDRPIIVKFKNVKQKWDIIKKSKLLNRKEAYKTIRISPDLTKTERIEERKLLEQLKKKKEEGEMDWTIRRGKLVRRNFLEQ